MNIRAGVFSWGIRRLAGLRELLGVTMVPLGPLSIQRDVQAVLGWGLRPSAGRIRGRILTW